MLGIKSFKVFPEFDDFRRIKGGVLILSTPNKKYFKPAEVADNFSLYKVAKMYKPKDCNSMLKYIEIKSEEQTKNKAPKILKKTIRQ